MEALRILLAGSNTDSVAEDEIMRCLILLRGYNQGAQCSVFSAATGNKHIMVSDVAGAILPAARS
jgi:lactate dehydrogenase-like 2-hydroxyacid dehydrogenase